MSLLILVALLGVIFSTSYAGVGVVIDASFGCNLAGVLASSATTNLLGKRDLILFATDQCFSYGPTTRQTFFQFVCATDGTNTVSLQQCDRGQKGEGLCRGTRVVVDQRVLGLHLCNTKLRW
jgi:hypothetical protein